MRYRMFALTLLVGVILWFTPPPSGLTLQAWRLFAIFITTIFGMISKPMPMAAVAVTGLFAVVATKTLSFDVAFSGFSDKAVWLIVFAFFIARGFIKTGLAMRISFLLMTKMGKSTLGLGYGIVVSELMLAPAIPSATARSGGIILPVIRALSDSYHSKPHEPSAGLMGSFLIKVAINTSCLTSSMFLTGMAANPVIASIAEEHGVRLTWGIWALAAIVPASVCLIFMPLLIYYLFPPGIKESPNATTLAKMQLQKMGKMGKNEWLMLGTLVILITLWIFGEHVGISAVVTAMFGLVILLVTGILTWKDVREESDAWETLIWFAALVTMAVQMGKLGFTEWLSQGLTTSVVQFDWTVGFTILSIFYFYSHYFFASNLAHVATLYGSFLGVSIAIGTPPLLAGLILAFFSSLFGALTQYSGGPAALLFGAGYVRINNWWKSGFIISVFYIFVWLSVGSIWWKVLGLW